MTDTRAGLGLAALGGALGLLAIALAVSLPEESAMLLPIPVEVAIGWSFIGAGLAAWARRPENQTGVLMTLTGLVWFGKQFEWWDTPLGNHLGHLSTFLDCLS